MRTLSPKRRNGVAAAPAEDGLDHALLGDAGIAQRRPAASGWPGPPSASRLETVPEPMIVPAASGRVRAAWAISAPKSKVMSTAGIGLAEGLAVDLAEQRQAELAAGPGGAEFVGRHGDRREGRGRL